MLTILVGWVLASVTCVLLPGDNASPCSDCGHNAAELAVDGYEPAEMPGLRGALEQSFREARRAAESDTNHALVAECGRRGRARSR